MFRPPSRRGDHRSDPLTPATYKVDDSLAHYAAYGCIAMVASAGISLAFIAGVAFIIKVMFL